MVAVIFENIIIFVLDLPVRPTRRYDNVRILWGNVMSGYPGITINWLPSLIAHRDFTPVNMQGIVAIPKR